MAANNIVGSVAVTVVPDSSGFGPALQAQLNGATAAAAAAGQRISSALGGADGSASTLSNTVSGISDGLKGVVAGVAGVTAALKASEFAAKRFAGFLGEVFDVSTKARIGFTALLGDAAKAETLLTDVTRLATASPFETEPLIEASQRLLGVGKAAETIVPTLTHVGDLISAMGGDPTNIESVLYALTQIQTVGRLTGQDAMQLKNSLIPITKLLSESLGKTQAEIQKLQEQGKITSDQVFEALDKAGIKVAGAMNNAVNTVSGSLSVLQDTLQGLYRESPFLQKLYVDVVAGIKAAAAFISSPEFVGAFQRTQEQALRVYEAIKPVLASFAEIGRTTAVNTLNLTAQALGALADVLDQIPEPILKLIITGLLANRTFAGVQGIQKIVAGFGGLKDAVLGVGKAAEVSGEQAAIAETKWMRWGRAAAQAASAAAIAAGSLISDGNGGARDVGGSALTGAGTGAEVGAQFGPQGAAIGAVAGAALGAYSSWQGQVEKQAQEHAARLKMIGEATARGYITSIEDKLSSGEGFTALTTNLQSVDDKVRASQAKLDELQRTLDNLGTGDAILNAVLPTPGITTGREDIENQIRDQKAVLDSQKAQAAIINEQINASYGNAQKNLEGIIPLLDQNSEAYENLTERGSVWALGLRTGSDDLQKSAEYLEKFGITLNDLNTKSVEQLAAIINQVSKMPEAFTNAQAAAAKFNTEFAASKDAAAAAYGPQQQFIAAQQGNISAQKAAQEAAIMSATNLADKSLKLNAQATALAAQQAAYALEYAKAKAAGATDAQAEAQAIASANRTIVETEKAVTAALEGASSKRRTAYEETQRAAADAAEQERATAATQAATTDRRIQQLEQLAGVTDSLANRQIAINVVVSGIEAALQKIALLKAQIASFTLGATKPGSGMSTGEAADQAAQNKAAIAAQQRIIDVLSGKVKDDKILQEYLGTIGADVKAASSKSGGGGGSSSGSSAAEDMATKIQSATDSLTTALQSARDAADQFAESLKADIRTSTQYTAAVSTNRLTKNANRQAADLAAVSTGASTLLSRGLSKEALKAAIGDIDATDLKQVRKLLASSPEQLASLSAAVAKRDTTASRVAAEATRTEQVGIIREAIIAAADALGYKVTKEQAQTAAEKAAGTTLSVGSIEVQDSTTVGDLLGALSGGKITR